MHVAVHFVPLPKHVPYTVYVNLFFVFLLFLWLRPHLTEAALRFLQLGFLLLALHTTVRSTPELLIIRHWWGTMALCLSSSTFWHSFQPLNQNHNEQEGRGSWAVWVSQRFRKMKKMKIKNKIKRRSKLGRSRKATVGSRWIECQSAWSSWLWCGQWLWTVCTLEFG